MLCSGSCESERVYYREWSASFGSLIICTSWFCAVRCGRVRLVEIQGSLSLGGSSPLCALTSIK